MRTLLEEYNEIYQKTEQFRSRIAECQGQIRSITGRRNDEIPVRIENLKRQLQKIDEYDMKISGFMDLAEKHLTSKNVLTIEAPPGYRVNLNRLRTWSMMIDPMSEDDPYAQRVYLVSKCDKLFLEKKKREFTERITELEKDYAVGAPDEIKELEAKIAGIQEELREYLNGEEFVGFSARVKRENEGNLYSEAPAKFQSLERDPDFWVPGAFGTALDGDEEARKLIKSKIGGFYDEKSGQIYIPVERIPSDEEFAMTVSCVPARKRLNEMDAGIRNLIFRQLDTAPAGTRRVYVFDGVRQNSSLIGTLKDLEGSYALPSIPRNMEQMQSSLEELVASFSDIDDVLGNYDSVLEYNRTVEREKQIPRLLVVIVGWPKVFEGAAKEQLHRIITNYERYGISFIAVRIASLENRREAEDSGFGLSDYVGENLIHIEMTSKKTTICFGSESEHSFSWYPFKHPLTEDYSASFHSLQQEKKGLGTEYTSRFNMDEPPVYQRGRKNLVLPYGVDSKDEIHSISFENENFAAYLMGASGSGKSTLLHTLITGILRNYHPDDVELWLADFKMSEFAQYIHPMPPHVKYILLDESQELVCDLIDRLTDKMMERQRFFMKNRKLKKVENVPSDTFMPVIFVMLDEFSIMSQAISELPDYRLKLQNLLAKGRALGMKFLFSSQTYTSGITGLTPTAKAQIQQRIAMKGSIEEITETLELSSSQKTDQVRAWMEALPPHYALVKFRDEDQVFVRRAQVMYFKGTSENAYERQKKLIEELNLRYKKSDQYEQGNSGTYLDKNPVVVDGNSYTAFQQGHISTAIKGEKNRRDKELSEDEIIFSFGRPRLMSEFRFAYMTPESRENILLLAPISEQGCAASIALSVYREFQMQEGETQVWAYGRDRIYRAYGALFDAPGRIICDFEEICQEIMGLKKQIQEGISGRRLIVLFGIDRICSEFEFADGFGGGAPDIGIKQYEMEDRIKEQELELEQSGAIAKTQEELDRVKLALALLNGESVESSPVESAREAAVEEAEEEAEQNDPKKKKEPYNVMADFQFILKQGSRMGYHFLAVFQNYADIRSSGMKMDYFRHRLSFQISADDSRDLFGSKIASQLPQHICQYTDQLEKFSLRPYLHNGIEWDGWTADENEEVINPLNI